MKQKEKYMGVKTRGVASPVFVWGDRWRWTGWQTGSVHRQYQQEQHCMPAAAQVPLQELQGLPWPSTQLAQMPARTTPSYWHSHVVTQNPVLKGMRKRAQHVHTWYKQSLIPTPGRPGLLVSWVFAERPQGSCVLWKDCYACETKNCADQKCVYESANHHWIWWHSWADEPPSNLDLLKRFQWTAQRHQYNLEPCLLSMQDVP